MDGVRGRRRRTARRHIRAESAGVVFAAAGRGPECRPHRAGAMRRERRSGMGHPHCSSAQLGDSCSGAAMIRRLIAIAAGTLIAAPALAQTTTADGVDAFLRGDYPRAVEIFAPLVSPLRPPDHVAEFFLAAMYENGLGVPVNPMRACAL